MSLVGLGACVVASVVWAQDSADRIAPATRAGQIDLERRQKAANLQPEEPSRVEHVFATVENDRIIQRIFGGVSGLRVRIGGMITGSGIAVGPEYNRPFLHNDAEFHASVLGSLEKWYLMDAGVRMPKLAGGHYFLNLYGVHRDFAAVDYYGPGPNSRRVGRSDYRLEDTAAEVTTGFNVADHLRIGGVGRFLAVNVGRGHDPAFASTDRIYSEATTPGLFYQSNFLQGGGFLQFDYRDEPGDPHGGGNYVARFMDYNDVRREHYSFERVDLDAQQYIGFFNKFRVIALRARVSATSPHRGNQVPFYLQPTLGGPDDLRGYRAFRYYGNNSIVMTAEYRWQVFTGMDMALFADAGRVFDRWRQISLRDLNSDAGFGFRFKMNGGVFMRIDTGFSAESFAIWLKFGNVF